MAVEPRTCVFMMLPVHINGARFRVLMRPVVAAVVDSLAFLPPPRICNHHCLSVCLAKTSKRICKKFSGKVGSGPMNKWLNFGGDSDHDRDHDPYCNTSKTCLGGGMHCTSACSSFCTDRICCMIRPQARRPGFRFLRLFCVITPYLLVYWWICAFVVLDLISSVSSKWFAA